MFFMSFELRHSDNLIEFVFTLNDSDYTIQISKSTHQVFWRDVPGFAFYFPEAAIDVIENPRD
jgi:hypothetical protein